MAILEKEPAIKYLNRALEALSAKKHPFSQIPLLHAMLHIQQAYVDRLARSGREQMAHVNIHPSGFPELNFWLEDIKSVFDEFAAVMRNRAVAMLPLIQQLTNANPEGIIRAGKDASKVFDIDTDLVKTLAEYSPEQMAFLKGVAKKGVDTELLYYDKSMPALLLATDQVNAFQSVRLTDRPNHNGVSGVPAIAGLKYIDSPHFINRYDTRKPTVRAPGFLYVAIGGHPGKLTVEHWRIGTEAISLGRPNYSGYSGWGQSPTVELSSSTRFIEDNWQSGQNSGDVKTATVFYENLRQIDSTLVKIFLDLDTADPELVKVEDLANSLPLFHQAIKDNRDFINLTLSGDINSGQEIDQRSQDISEKLKNLYLSLPNDKARNDVQLAAAAILAPSLARAHALIPSDQSVATLTTGANAPGKKRKGLLGIFGK